MANNRRRGGCLCGAVRFDVELPESSFSICHCGMCRRWGGGPFEAAHCRDPHFAKEDGLSWYRSSDWGERGFCNRCGTSLFWRLADKTKGMMAVSVESLDDNADLSLLHHIYVDHKPDRYEFADDRPRLTEAEFLGSMGFGSPSEK